MKNAEKAKAEAEELAAAANDEASTQKAEEAKAKAAEIEARIPDYQQKASDAIAAKHEAIAAYEAAIEEVKAARQARGEDVSKVCIIAYAGEYYEFAAYRRGRDAVKMTTSDNRGKYDNSQLNSGKTARIDFRAVFPAVFKLG